MKILLFFATLTMGALLAATVNVEAQRKSPSGKSSGLPTGAVITEIRVGKGFVFPVVNLAEKPKANIINDLLMRDALSDEIDGNVTATSIKALFERQNKQRYRQGLAAIGYKVLLNSPTVLSLSIQIEVIGAHSNGWENRYNFDLSTGERFTLDQIVDLSAQDDIKKMILADSRKRLIKVKNDVIRDMTSGTGGWNGGRELWFEKDMLDTSYENNWQANMSKEYSEIEIGQKFVLSIKGISFDYETSIGFPMSVRNLEPSSRYFYPWSVLRPYILSSSPLAALMK